jgi:amino acid adenylation domain-containing protein/non-ribosomal peptide synthase protein (TIGR01720 family)
MVGVFINTLPVRVEVRGEEKVGEYLRRLQEQLVEMREYEYSPLVKVQGWSEAPRGEQLFDSIVVFENYPVDKALKNRRSDIKIEQWQSVERSNYGITLSANSGSQLKLKLNYKETVVDKDSISALIRHLERLLEEMAEGEGRPVGELRMLSEEELHQLLVDWNQTRRDYPEACLHHLITRQAQRNPQSVAVISGGRELTYRELDERANQLAHYLRERGVGVESRVGVCLERSIELVVALLGTLKAGAAYVPLDPAYPAQRLQWMIEDADLCSVITQRSLVSVIEGAGRQSLLIDESSSLLAREPRTAPDVPLVPDHLAYLIYTSGSTGWPKAVMVEHRQLVNVLDAARERFEIDEMDTSLCLASPAFDIALFELCAVLICGGRAEVLTREEVLDVERIVERLSKVTVLHAVPALMRPVIQAVRAARGGRNLRLALTGGDLVSPDLMEEMKEVFPNAHIEVLYGPTETTIICITYDAQRGVKEEGHPIGRPLGNVEVRIVNEQGDLAPRGVPGELLIGGLGVSRGYWERPELTAARYAEIEGRRYYRSGDLARYLPDGRLEFLGRKDDQVKIRGYRIELGEIETALRDQGEVRECAVVVREGRGGQPQLVCYVETEAEEWEAEAARERLRERLPEYMVPQVYVRLERLPLTANGKIDRRGLPAPDQERSEGKSHVAPRNATERLLAEIWGGVLGLEDVGVEDNFFELGGDSILSIQVVARARQQGLQLRPKQLFQHQTIERLAAVARREGTTAAAQGKVTGGVPLTPIQRRFFEQEVKRRERFTQAVMLEVEGELEVEALKEAVRGLLRHHDGLRMRYRRDGGEWRQENAGEESNEVVEVVELGSVGGGEQRVEIEREAERTQRSLNLEAGPLLRVKVMRLRDGRGSRVLVVAHHLVVDVVSWQVLLTDLERGYRQACDGEEVGYGEKTMSYRQWAMELEEAGERGKWDGEAEYWKMEDAGGEGIRVDRREEGNVVGESEVESARLSEEETRRLLQDAGKAYRTRVDELLLSALGEALCEWSGTGSVRVDVEGHGREEVSEEVDVTRTVGWFTSIYPVVLRRRGEGREREQICEVKEKMRGIVDGGIGYGVLRYVRRRGEGWRDGEVSFNYLGQLDQVVSGGSFKVAGESAGASLSEEEKRRYVLDVMCAVQGGKLEVKIGYGARMYRRGAVSGLLEKYLEKVRGVLRHCLSEEAGGYTPSDFPLAGVPQQELDNIFSEIEFEVN